MKEISILGIKVNDITKSETVDLINKFAEEKDKSHLIVTLGTEMVMAAREDNDIKELINGAEAVCADGVGIVLASKIKKQQIREKAAGVEILEETVRQSAETGKKIFFLGSKPGIAEKAAEKLREKYPGCNIAGTFHGYFKDDEEAKAEIRKASPDIIFIALGFPRQEKWYREYGKELGIPVGIGVGGSFDVISGNIERAPSWMRKLCLEWLFRLIKEPARWKRMLALPKFAIAVIMSK
ncbi:MAG: WecB/TagA/CpsF family glycosyltransferase [bacterium]|nr:WecB/TagA/CpsF family glycosyltransferase [bacterium]